MKLTNEQIQAILDGAEKRGDWAVCFDWLCDNYSPYNNYHNTSDLREILELRQEVERLKSMVTRKLNRSLKQVDRYTNANSETHNFHGGWSKGYYEGIVTVCEQVLDQLREQSDE